MRTKLLLLAASLTLVACNATPVPAAPDDVNGLYKWTWTNLERASDAELNNAATKMFVTSDDGGVRKGALKLLTREELGVVGLADAGVALEKSAGLFIFNSFECTSDKIEKILSNIDQKAQYPSLYWSFERTHTADAMKYFARMLPVLSWDSKAGSDVLGAKYTTNQKGVVRRVKNPDGVGDVLVTRTWMVTPAVFEKMDGDVTLGLDDHAGIYWEREPGRVFHAWGVWRQTEIKGLMLTTEKFELKNIILDRLLEHDGKTATLCKSIM